MLFFGHWVALPVATAAVGAIWGYNNYSNTRVIQEKKKIETLKNEEKYELTMSFPETMQQKISDKLKEKKKNLEDQPNVKFTVNNHFIALEGSGKDLQKLLDDDLISSVRTISIKHIEKKESGEHEKSTHNNSTMLKRTLKSEEYEKSTHNDNTILERTIKSAEYVNTMWTDDPETDPKTGICYEIDSPTFLEGKFTKMVVLVMDRDMVKLDEKNMKIIESVMMDQSLCFSSCDTEKEILPTVGLILSGSNQGKKTNDEIRKQLLNNESLIELLHTSSKTCKVYYHDMSLCWIFKRLHTYMSEFLSYEKYFDKSARDGSLPEFSFVEPKYFDENIAASLIVKTINSLFSENSKSKDNTLLLCVFSGGPLIHENKEVSAFFVSPHIKPGKISEKFQLSSINKLISEFYGLGVINENGKEVNLKQYLKWTEPYDLKVFPPFETCLKMKRSISLTSLAEKLLGYDSRSFGPQEKITARNVHFGDAIKERISSNIALISRDDPV